MGKIFPLFAALTVFAGCAASSKEAVPRAETAAPAAVETGCACQPGWLSVSVPAPWEWREDGSAECCHAGLFHIITSVYAEITLAAAPDPDSFAGSVEMLVGQLPGLGYDLTDQPLLGQDAAGRAVASLHFRGTGEYGHMRGKIAFRESRTPGTILVFQGSWHYLSEPDAETSFDAVVSGSRDRPVGE